MAVGIASVITFFGFGNHSVKAQTTVTQPVFYGYTSGPGTLVPHYDPFNTILLLKEYSIVIKREFSKNSFILKISSKTYSEDKENVYYYSGVLYNENISPLTHIYITNKRTHARTRTDKKGQFSMSVKDEDILYCSHKKFIAGDKLDKNIIEPIILNIE